MAVTKKIIGRIPICFGTWYAKQGGWGIKNRVTLYGSEFESLHEGNTVPPAVYDDVNHTVTFNESDWRVISNGTEAWLADTKINALGTWTESPEFIRVYLDGEDKFLFGIRVDGSVEWAVGVPTPIREEIDRILSKIDETLTARVAEIEAKLEEMEQTYGTITDSPEWIRVYLDADGKVLFGIRQDGSVEWAVGIPTPIREAIDTILQEKVSELEEVVKSVATIEDNPEFIRLYTDNENHLLWGIKADGTIEWGAGIPTPIQEAINALYRYIDEKPSSFDEIFKVVSSSEYVFAIVDAEDKFLCGVTVEGEWKTWKSDTPVDPDDPSWIEDWFEEFNDPECRSEMTLDAEQRILGYRDANGVWHENYLAVDKKLELSSEAMTDFQQALKNSGFSPGGGGDWTDREVIELPEPKHYALLNIDVDYLPLNDGDVRNAEIQYYDGLGNFFKMDAEIEPQGQTSRIFARTGGKGNYTLDLSKDVKFGSWVPQDSFHLKGAAKDVTRGILPTSYKWAYMMQEYLDARPNRVLLKADSKTTTTSASGDRFTDWGDGARCLPDGFPMELYVNGEYFGLYAIQLKKHRKNYSMDKKDYTSFFLDADKMMTNNLQHGLWDEGPDAVNRDTPTRTWWNGFDIKGPKDLICMDGSKFDGDAPKELIDDTSPIYDASNKKHKGSATTKSIIRGFQTKYLEVKTLIDNNDTEAAKAKFSENFDYDACMMVYIYNCLMMNADSVQKNTLWGTYKNGKIFPSLWDLDGMYGQGWVGDSAAAPSTGVFTTYANAEWPLKLFATLYQTEIRAAYAALRKAKVVSIDTWHDIVFNQWVNRIGEEAYSRDIEKWPETPSYRENYLNSDYWEQIGWTASPGSTPVWTEGQTYSAGTTVVIRCHPTATGYIVWMRYKARVDTDKCPVKQFYIGFPVVGGFFDSPKRWEKWMLEQIKLCDVFNDYFAELSADFTAYRSTDSEYEIQCINMAVDSNLSKQYNYIQGHITKHYSDGVYTYTIDGGAETPEDTSKTYTTVKAAIEAASGQEVDVPSENVFYIQARAKNINYYKNV